MHTWGIVDEEWLIRCQGLLPLDVLDGVVSQIVVQDVIGLAELGPSEETLPYLQEIALKRDQYSHLAVKSLINGGQPGLQIVFDILNNSKDSEADKRLLQDAIDHVNYDEETEAFLKKTIETSKQTVAVEFAKSI